MCRNRVCTPGLGYARHSAMPRNAWAGELPVLYTALDVGTKYLRTAQSQSTMYIVYAARSYAWPIEGQAQKEPYVYMCRRPYNSERASSPIELQIHSIYTCVRVRSISHPSAWSPATSIPPHCTQASSHGGLVSALTIILYT